MFIVCESLLNESFIAIFVYEWRRPPRISFIVTIFRMFHWGMHCYFWNLTITCPLPIPKLCLFFCRLLTMGWITFGKLLYVLILKYLFIQEVRSECKISLKNVHVLYRGNFLWKCQYICNILLEVRFLRMFFEIHILHDCRHLYSMVLKSWHYQKLEWWAKHGPSEVVVSVVLLACRTSEIVENISCPLMANMLFKASKAHW